jgi:hypothetical protein
MLIKKFFISSDTPHISVVLCGSHRMVGLEESKYPNRGGPISFSSTSPVLGASDLFVLGSYN